METATDFSFLGSKTTVDSDRSHKMVAQKEEKWMVFGDNWESRKGRTSWLIGYQKFFQDRQLGWGLCSDTGKGDFAVQFARRRSPKVKLIISSGNRPGKKKREQDWEFMQWLVLFELLPDLSRRLKEISICLSVYIFLEKDYPEQHHLKLCELEGGLLEWLTQDYF